ncbi:MAG TPA: RluA family pseudouridine synthase, partial [Clostridiales bacterium]|nr:RluA family pseudouridine synthase [Clostridiales bacterium]
IELKIVYEDDDLLIVDKPRGMVVHPAAGNPDGTLVNALLDYCGDNLSSLNGPGRPGIVHRLDKDTGGLIIVAKNDVTHASLAKQLKDRTMKREYIAVIHGVLKNLEGTIDKPIGRNKNDRKKFAVNVENAKEAISHYSLIEQFDKYALIKVELVTGRTHQIRVHMASIGNPVAGDRVYGPKYTPLFLEGQCLHAFCLGFTHPKTGKYIEIKADLPQYFKDFIERIK